MLSIDADYTGLELVSFLILCSGLLCVGVTCVPGAHEKSLGTGTSRGKIRVCGVHSTLRVAGGIGSRQGSWYAVQYVGAVSMKNQLRSSHPDSRCEMGLKFCRKTWSLICERCVCELWVPVAHSDACTCAAAARLQAAGLVLKWSAPRGVRKAFHCSPVQPELTMPGGGSGGAVERKARLPRTLRRETEATASLHAAEAALRGA